MTATLTPPADALAGFLRTVIVAAGPVRVDWVQLRPGAGRYVFTPDDQPAPIVLRHLSDVAMALHYSGAPLDRSLTAHQVAALVVAGVRAVGAAHISATDNAERDTNGRFFAGQITDQQRRDRDGRPWSDRRERQCAGAAVTLAGFRRIGGAA